MRKPKTHQISRGMLTGEGPTKAAAKADLERQIDAALASRSVTLEPRFGRVIVIIPTPRGWESTLVYADDHGRQFHCHTSQGHCDHAKVLQSARLNAAQAAWSHETDDEAHIACAGLTIAYTAELRGWITWQRSYRRAIEQDKTDQQAHAIACGYDCATA